MASEKWRTVQIPSSLYERIQDFVSEPNSGYTGVADFVREAIRISMKEIGAIRGEPRILISDSLRTELHSLHKAKGSGSFDEFAKEVLTEGMNQWKKRKS